MGEIEAQDPLDRSFLEVSTTPEFECDICGRTFFNKSSLKRHMNVQMISKSNVESVHNF